MAFRQVSWFNFRNLADLELELPEKIYILVGENGAGKSSVLEALYLLSYGSSFREKTVSNLMRSPEGITRVSGCFEEAAEHHSVCIQCSGLKGTKDISLNGKKLQDRKELLQLSPSIVFAHGDIRYINGSPKEKRWFIDQTISLTDPVYLAVYRQYSRCLQQRNAVLRSRQSGMLESYTVQLADLGWQVQQKRKKHIEDLNQVFRPLFETVSNTGQRVELEYQPSWRNLESASAAAEFLFVSQERDWQQGSTQTGPHRDGLAFWTYLGDRRCDFVKLASTGQLRLASLILKSAQASYLTQSTSRASILLLDDVLLEMDRERCKIFLENLPVYQQMFFTFLPDEDFSHYRFTDYQVLRVRGGEISSQR